MRQIKKFMEAKRPMWNCNECKCITMQCWKESEAFCGCGENKLSLPNYVRVGGDEFGQYWVRFFNDNEEQDNTVRIENDEETGGIKTVVGEFLGIENEDTRALWLGVWEAIDAEAIEKLFGIDEGKTGVGQFTPEAMAQFNSFINNPTEEQAQILRRWIEDITSDEYDPPRYPIVIFTQPTLLSYEEIMAIPEPQDKVDELNKAPLPYFNKFTEEGHMDGLSLEGTLQTVTFDAEGTQEWVARSR